MTEPLTLAQRLEEDCRNRAKMSFESNKAWGRKGPEWALEAEHEWKVAELIARLTADNKALTAEVEMLREVKHSSHWKTRAEEAERLAARLSENNRWPDPLQSPQAEAIRNGKIDMTEIVSLFDKMERELEQLRLMAGERDRLAADNARLRAALEPFANEANEWTEYADAEGLVEGWRDGPTSSLNVGHLRRARAILAGKE